MGGPDFTPVFMRPKGGVHTPGQIGHEGSLLHGVQIHSDKLSRTRQQFRVELTRNLCVRLESGHERFEGGSVDFPRHLNG
jgi:hypothetical protein